MSYDPANNCSWDKTLMRSDRGKGEKEEVFPSDNSSNYNSREVVGIDCSNIISHRLLPSHNHSSRTEADVSITMIRCRF
jgi:hypothetical protein